MRIFKFWNEKGDEKEKRSDKFKESSNVSSNDYKDKVISVEYVSKKGKTN